MKTIRQIETIEELLTLIRINHVSAELFLSPREDSLSLHLVNLPHRGSENENYVLVPGFPLYELLKHAIENSNHGITFNYK